MQTINVVRNAETISLLTITSAGVVCVDIPLPSGTGNSVVINSDFLNLSVPPAKISKMKPLSEGLNITGTDGTRSVIPVLQNKRLPMLKESFEQCTKEECLSKKQGIGVVRVIGNQTRKKINTKYTRGKRKTN
jgi:hypothetical protein